MSLSVHVFYSMRFFTPNTPKFVRSAFGLISLLLAVNYFGFQTELFGDKYREFHPQQVTGWTISSPTTNWESFDKDNAPKAFVVSVFVPLVEISTVTAEQKPSIPHVPAFHPIRDKSPPHA